MMHSRASQISLVMLEHGVGVCTRLKLTPLLLYQYSIIHSFITHILPPYGQVCLASECNTFLLP